MNLAPQQKDLLFKIVDEHLSSDRVPFKFVQHSGGSFLVYPRGRSIPIEATELDFRLLAEEKLVILGFEPMLHGQPTQSGIEMAASLRNTPVSAGESVQLTGELRGNVAKERGWEDLAAEVNRIKQSGESLRALWSAYEGHENYGVWLLVQGNGGTKEAIADFGLFAARAIAKLGIPPSPIPSPSEHSPLWKLYCETQEEIARLQGKERDFSDAVPFGLGVVDRDAVDPCTRAWLEVLRQGGEVRQSEGSESIKDQRCRTFAGAITDVYGESAIYCKRGARDELMTERQQDSTGPNISRQANPQTPRSSDDYSARAADGAPYALESVSKRGRRPNHERRDAIHSALTKHGDKWRDHLNEIFTDLNGQGVALGDFQTMKVDLGDGQKSTVSNWADLDFAEEEQRRQIIDTLRKYLG